MFIIITVLSLPDGTNTPTTFTYSTSSLLAVYKPEYFLHLPFSKKWISKKCCMKYMNEETSFQKSVRTVFLQFCGMHHAPTQTSLEVDIFSSKTHLNDVILFDFQNIWCNNIYLIEKWLTDKNTKYNWSGLCFSQMLIWKKN